tara:strand:- start:4037 stop:4999 length:963 start_codon:yes stop_codon:yes gene_type:complete
MSSRVTSADGAGVHVREYLPRALSRDVARERAPKVVLAHANGFHGGVFEPLARALCDRGYACYALDFRGHGASDAVSVDALTWGALADDCAAVVTALGLHRCAAFGHSCGGHALLMCEARRPGTFRAIYAFEPIFVVSSSDVPTLDVSPGSPLMASTAYMVKSASRRRARFANAAEALNAYKSKPPMSAWSEDALDAYVNRGGFVPDDDGGVRLACSTETEIGIYRAGDKETTAFGELKSIACPVAIARGRSTTPDGASPIYSAVIAPAIAAAVRDGRLIEFPDNGHLAPMEIPRDVARSALDFFDAARGDDVIRARSKL